MISDSFSVVVPVYCTVQSLAELAERLGRVFRDELDADYEIIFVDDCSPNPDTWPALVALAEADPAHVHAIRLTRNFGQQAATLCGMAAATGDFVVTMDDDLQHLPEDLPALARLREHDIVLAEFPRRRHSLFKRVASYIKGWFDTWILHKPRGIRLTPYRILSRPVVDGVLTVATPFPFLSALMLAVSRDVVTAPATHGRRQEGRTGYTLSKMIALFRNLLINQSAMLLKLIGQVGMTVALASFGFAGWVVWNKVDSGAAVLGWSSLMTAVLFIGGLLLVAMGIVGEYLIRIIAAAERRPTFHVRERTPRPSDP